MTFAVLVRIARTVGRHFREAIAALHRLGDGLLITEPAAVYDRWSRFRAEVRRVALAFSDKATDLGVPSVRLWEHAESGPERWDLGWPRTRSIRKRRLTQAEWAALGDEVKRCRRALNEAGSILQAGHGKARCRRVFALADRLDRLKCRLDASVHRRHPGWPEFSRVFFGADSKDDPILARSIVRSSLRLVN